MLRYKLTNKEQKAYIVLLFRVTRQHHDKTAITTELLNGYNDCIFEDILLYLLVLVPSLSIPHRALLEPRIGHLLLDVFCS